MPAHPAAGGHARRAPPVRRGGVGPHLRRRRHLRAGRAGRGRPGPDRRHARQVVAEECAARAAGPSTTPSSSAGSSTATTCPPWQRWLSPAHRGRHHRDRGAVGGPASRSTTTPCRRSAVARRDARRLGPPVPRLHATGPASTSPSPGRVRRPDDLGWAGGVLHRRPGKPSWRSRPRTAAPSATTTGWVSTGPASSPRLWAPPTGRSSSSRRPSTPAASSTRASSGCPPPSVERLALTRPSARGPHRGRCGAGDPRGGPARRARPSKR